MHFCYLTFSLALATVMARPEPPVFMGLQQQNERVLPLNVHAAKPHVYQQLPQEQSFASFVDISSIHSAPTVPKPADNLNPANSETEDSYNVAYRQSFSQQHQTGYDHGPTETQVHKHIYVHVPPKDFEEENAVQPRVTHQIGPKQKHYKIVFIKAPEAPSVRTPIVPPLPQNEEKTLIYVLHKKPEAQPDIVIPTPEPTQPSKPEVYFIKYKTKRDEAPVYGPPPAFDELQSRQTANVVSNLSIDSFRPMDLQQLEFEATTQQPQYHEEREHQQAQPQSVTEEPAVPAADFSNASTERNFVNEEVSATTVEPLNQYLPPETTLAPIVVKEMEESTHLPALTYGAPKRNRFFIKKRK